MSTTQDEIRKALQGAHPKDVEAARWYTLYLKCTPQERGELVAAMLERIESRESESIEVYKRDPLMLDGLTAPQLHNAAIEGMSDAHQWFLDKYPSAKDMLYALECLSNFVTSSKDVLSLRDMRAVVDALETVWNIHPFIKVEKPITVRTPKNPTGKARNKK